MSVFKKKNKNGTTSYGYDFRDRVTGTRYRKIVPLARTKWDAEQAETVAKKELFEKRFGVEEKGTALLSEFLDEVYLPWSKANKKSWRDDAYMLSSVAADLHITELVDGNKGVHMMIPKNIFVTNSSKP